MTVTTCSQVATQSYNLGSISEIVQLFYGYERTIQFSTYILHYQSIDCNAVTALLELFTVILQTDVPVIHKTWIPRITVT